jgi:periodic tryptophan protein 2
MSTDVIMLPLVVLYMCLLLYTCSFLIHLYPPPLPLPLTYVHRCRQKSYTLPFETIKDISRIVLSPNGSTLIAVDEDGRCIVINYFKRVPLCQFHFGEPVLDIKFSPDSKYVAVTHGSHVQVWHAPALITQARPFRLHRTYTGHYDDVTHIEWSPDGLFILTGSKDMTCRLYSLDPIPGFVPLVLAGHRDRIVSCFFGEEGVNADEPIGTTVYTVAKDSALYVWKFEARDSESESKSKSNSKSDSDSDSDSDDNKNDADNVPFLGRGNYRLHEKHFFQQNHARVHSCALHRSKTSNMLVVGFHSGVFALYDLPDFTHIHTLSISQKQINTVAINCSGEWLAFGSAQLGQLLVWEWQSETYVLKQQGHFHNINSLSYSPDGQLIATGGDDGKVKLWNSTTGFCFITFTDHTAPISAVSFSATGTVIISASLDGTVRAYDLVRYRNFRTLTSPTPCQYISLAIDPSGDVVCAGSMDPFDISVWSLQTGRLLDVLSGHTGPVSSLSFNPAQSLLLSGSWDGSSRVWDVFMRKASVESFEHSTDVLAVAFRPDGREACVSTLDGQLNFWDVSTGSQKGVINGREDIRGGRLESDVRTSKNSTRGTAFTSVCYTADGKCLLAGGNSKFVCIYEIQQRILLRKFQISHNRSLDGILNKLNSKYLTEAGVSMAQINAPNENDDDMLEDVQARLDKSLPGARRGDFSERKLTKAAVATRCVQFSATGRQWAAASTEGLLIYSLDDSMTFDPFDLDVDITPANTVKLLQKNPPEFTKALVMSLRLNEHRLIRHVVEHVPASDVPLVIQSVPVLYINRLMEVLVDGVSQSHHIEFYLLWCQHLLAVHGRHLKKDAPVYASTLRALQKQVQEQLSGLVDICDENQYLLDYLCVAPGPTSGEPSMADLVAARDEKFGGADDDDDDDDVAELDAGDNDFGMMSNWGGEADAEATAEATAEAEPQKSNPVGPQHDTPMETVTSATPVKRDGDNPEKNENTTQLSRSARRRRRRKSQTPADAKMEDAPQSTTSKSSEAPTTPVAATAAAAETGTTPKSTASSKRRARRKRAKRVKVDEE